MDASKYYDDAMNRAENRYHRALSDNPFTEHSIMYYRRMEGVAAISAAVAGERNRCLTALYKCRTRFADYNVPEPFEVTEILGL